MRIGKYSKATNTFQKPTMQFQKPSRQKLHYATALSNYVHKLKKRGENFTIKCSIKSRASTFKNGAKRCMLCVREKVAIALHDPKTLLNTKSEILHKCIHMTKFELRSCLKKETNGS